MLIALLVCLIPTTIGGLLSAIGIAGMDRVLQRNVLAMSRARGRSGRRRRHAAARQDRHDHPRQPASDRDRPCAAASTRKQLYRAAYIASLADETPEGRSIVLLAGSLLRPRRRRRRLAERAAGRCGRGAVQRVHAHVAVSTIADGAQVRKGAPDAVRAWVAQSAARRVATDAARGRSRDDRARRRHAAAAGATAAASSAASRCATSSSRTCASASTGCARWGFAR